MQIDEFTFPDDLYYDKEHGWARVEGNVVVQGMTDYGQNLAGEIIYAEIPRTGRDVELGKPFMSMESGKWVGRVKAPLSGKISAANEEIEWESDLVNKDPYGEGWLAQIEASNLGELEGLMKADSSEFAAFIASEREKYEK